MNESIITDDLIFFQDPCTGQPLVLSGSPDKKGIARTLSDGYTYNCDTILQIEAQTRPISPITGDALKMHDGKLLAFPNLALNAALYDEDSNNDYLIQLSSITSQLKKLTEHNLKIPEQAEIFVNTVRNPIALTALKNTVFVEEYNGTDIVPNFFLCPFYFSALPISATLFADGTTRSMVDVKDNTDNYWQGVYGTYSRQHFPDHMRCEFPNHQLQQAMQFYQLANYVLNNRRDLEYLNKFDNCEILEVEISNDEQLTLTELITNIVSVVLDNCNDQYGQALLQQLNKTSDDLTAAKFLLKYLSGQTRTFLLGIFSRVDNSSKGFDHNLLQAIDQSYAIKNALDIGKLSTQNDHDRQLAKKEVLYKLKMYIKNSPDNASRCSCRPI